MGQITGIEWTDHTFNPWRGCTKISAGCANCYAETLSGRNPKTLGVWGPQGTRVVAAESAWREPLKWDRDAKRDGVRRRVFCASLADVFEGWTGPMLDSSGNRLHCGEGLVGGTVRSKHWYSESPCDEEPGPWLVMQDVRSRLFELIDSTPNLDWLVLTKRPENALKMTYDTWCKRVPGHISQNEGDGHRWQWPANLWLGTSVENQAAADERIPHLLRIPGAVRFLSCEPLLDRVILHKYFAQCECGHGHGFTACPNTGGVAQTCHQCDCRQLRPKLRWVIVGGESGHDARPMRVEWARSLVRQCKAAGVACFVKQLGVNVSTRLPDGETWPGHVGPLSPVQFHGDGFGNYTVRGLKDKKGGDPAEWPHDLRVREFPIAT